MEEERSVVIEPMSGNVPNFIPEGRLSSDDGLDDSWIG